MKIKQLRIFFVVIVTCFLSNTVFGMQLEEKLLIAIKSGQAARVNTLRDELIQEDFDFKKTVADGKTFLEIAQANLAEADAEVEKQKAAAIKNAESKEQQGRVLRANKITELITKAQNAQTASAKIVTLLTPPFEKPKMARSKTLPASTIDDAKRQAAADAKAKEDKRKAADTKRGQDAGKKDGAAHGKDNKKDLSAMKSESDEFKIAYQAAYEPAFGDARKQAEDAKRQADALAAAKKKDDDAKRQAADDMKRQKEEEKSAGEGLDELVGAIKDHDLKTVQQLLKDHPNMKKTAIIEKGPHKGKRSVEVFLETLQESLDKSKEKGLGKQFYDYFAKKANTKTYDAQRNDDLAIRDALREYLGMPPAPKENVAGQKEPGKEEPGKDSAGELAAKITVLHEKLVVLNGLLTGLAAKR